MKKLAWQSALLVGILIILTAFFRIRLNNTYTAYLPEMSGEFESEESAAFWSKDAIKEEDASVGVAVPDDGEGSINPEGGRNDAATGNVKTSVNGKAPEQEGSPENGGAPENGEINFDVQVRNMENETGGIDVRETLAQNDMPAIAVEAQEPGEYIASVKDESGEMVSQRRYRVDEFRNVYDYSTGGFTGDLILMSSITAFLLIESFLLMSAFFRAKGPDFYAYSTIHLAGFALFLLQTGICMLIMTIRHQLDPVSYTMRYVYNILSSASLYFILLTSPFILAFAIAMSVSNIALIRHEGKRRRNLLGILISVLMIVGMIAAFVIFFGRHTNGMETGDVTSRMILTLQNVYATAYVYFECMLFGAMICGTIAANHVPSTDCSHIVILGCGFRKDGTLPPLLRGRVDRAIEFWNMQKREHKPQAIFVPSGGQGPNECMPEASAMENYLVSQGIPKEQICPEKKSRNTYQNMSFSRELIEEKDPDAKVIFSTTNYHVFRSGVWASLAGLRAEGIGSNTKWWYWPNAFMRECVGLLANKWKQEMVLMLLMIGIFLLLSVLL